MEDEFHILSCLKNVLESEEVAEVNINKNFFVYTHLTLVPK